MPKAEASIHIHAPPGVVFDFVADAARIPEYVAFVRDVYEISEGPVGVGTTLKEHAKPGPFPVVTSWRIVEFERPRRQIWSGHQTDMEMTLTKLIEPIEGGTLYRQVMEYRYLPRIRPLGWLLEQLAVNRKLRIEFARITEGIKTIVESEHKAHQQ